jgi:glycosyltransferase involved in cell wall biosynthesis
MTETIDILLATFNGAQFLPEQLASLERQTHADWRLIIRDDGSTDRSVAILDAFAGRHGERVRILRDDRGRLGSRGNFAALLEASDAPYFMFCDQDDLWLPDKIADLLGTLRAVEERRGDETPILAHSDLILVDNGFRTLHRSFWRHARLLDPSRRQRPAQLMLRNFVTGCASLGNAALRRAALPIPQDAVVHDWWLAIVAAFLGEIVASEAPTVLYRQHQGNEFGARPRNLFGVVGQLLRAPGAEVRRTRSHVAKAQRQAATLQQTYQAALSPEANRMLREYAEIGKAGWWRRKSFLFRYDLSLDYWLPTAVCWLFL